MAEPRCSTCNRNPERVNSDIAECSHVECPTRHIAWSERPARGYRAPEAYDPLDRLFDQEG